MIWINILLFFILQIILFGLVSKGDNKLILWPEYFDKSLSRCGGRRVSLNLATQTPTVEDIARAAKKLKLNPKIEHNKSYPGRWWRKTGRVVVRAADKKSKVIKRIAFSLKKSQKK